MSLAETAALAGYMSVIAQVLLWMGRLVGTGIGEEFGLLVCDYFRDEDQRPWLDFSKQGGRVPGQGRRVRKSRSSGSRNTRAQDTEG